MKATARRGPRRHIGAGIFVFVVLLFLFAPLVVMVAFSFNSSPSLSLPFTGLSFEWYREIASDPLVTRAFRRSIQAALITALVAGILSLLAALGMRRLSVRTRAAIHTIVIGPLAIPVLLLGIGLAVLFRQAGFGFSLWTTIAGHVLIALPFVFLVIGAGFDRFQFSLLDAAEDLGASPWYAFRTITLPLILPSVLGAMLLAMAISIDEFVIAFFTAGQEKTLPLVLYGRILKGVDPSLNAIGTVMLIMTSGLAFLSARKTTRSSA